MALDLITNIEDLKKDLYNTLSTMDEDIIEALNYIGMQCIKKAREIPMEVGFQDQTGALRSSIGYSVFYNGELIKSNYEPITESNNTESKTLTKTKEGTEKGKELSEQVGRNSTGYCLVVTAGMNYACYLESKGRDVLTSTEQYANDIVPRILAELLNTGKQNEK